MEKFSLLLKRITAKGEIPVLSFDVNLREALLEKFELRVKQDS